MLALPTLLATLAAFASWTTAVSHSILEIDRREPINSTTSAWVYGAKHGNITFAVTAVTSSGDLYFHLEAPADNNYVAIGTGEEMDDSLMWIVYRSSDGKGVTLSPRTVDGNVEPSYDDKTGCQLNTNDGITNGITSLDSKDIYAVNGYCKGINGKSYRKRESDGGGGGKGKISFSSTNQPFIFALGPDDRDLRSSSMSAGIRRHILYGTFSMDLSKASVQDSDDVFQTQLSSVGGWTNHNAQTLENPKNDRDWSAPIHTVVMCGTFVILFPIGVIFLRLLEKVRWHAWIQGFGMVLAVLGVGVGIKLGLEYNHSKNVNSAHQILGLFVVVFTIAQFTLGFIHHRIYKKHSRPTIMGKIHLYMGPFILLAGAINGFLGFNFTGSPSHNIWYGALVAVIFAGMAVLLFWANRRKARKVKASSVTLGNERFEPYSPRGERGRMDASMSGVPLREIPSEAPPEYERPAQPRPMV